MKAFQEIEPAKAVLKKASLRATPVRAGVLAVLSKATTPLDVPKIVAQLKGPIELPTVYRTLETFRKHGIVRRIRGGDRAWLYALGSAGGQVRHEHPHFVCESCSRVDCLDNATVPKNFIKSLGINVKYQIRFAEVVLHGLCPRCNARRK